MKENTMTGLLIQVPADMSGQRHYFSKYTEVEVESWLVKGVGGISLPVHGLGEVNIVT